MQNVSELDLMTDLIKTFDGLEGESLQKANKAAELLSRLSSLLSARRSAAPAQPQKTQQWLSEGDRAMLGSVKSNPMPPEEAKLRSIMDAHFKEHGKPNSAPVVLQNPKATPRMEVPPPVLPAAATSSPAAPKKEARTIPSVPDYASLYPFPLNPQSAPARTLPQMGVPPPVLPAARTQGTGAVPDYASLYPFPMSSK